MREKLRGVGSRALSRGIDAVAKRLYGQENPSWGADQRAEGIVLTGSSKDALEHAERLARDAGLPVKTSSDPASEITRPRAGRTFGARFDHYPILAPTGPLPAKGSEAVWDLTPQLVPLQKQALLEYKESLVLAFTGVASPESERVEDQLLELHPILEPQCCVLFARVGNVEQERLFRRVRLGNLVLTLPHVPVVLFFHASPEGLLKYRSLAHGVLDATAPRFGIVALLGGQSQVPAGAQGVLELQVGQTRHRSTPEEGYRREFSAQLPLEGLEHDRVSPRRGA